MNVQKLDSQEVQNLVYVKTNIGGWFFDAYLKVDHTSRLTITEHPVQSGAEISDHSFLNPKELSIDVGMTDVASSIVSGQFSDGPSRSVTAYNVLKDLQAKRIPLQVFTRLGIYQNMLIEVLSAPDDYKTMNGLRASVTLKEVLVAQVTTVKVSARPQVTDSSNNGNVQAVNPNESILYQLDKLLRGK